MPTNVDNEEIAKFDDLASDWWNPNGAMKALHDINPLRLSYIQKHTNLDQQRVLDVGCGGGILSESLAKSGAKVTGLDMSEEGISAARKHAEDNHIDIKYIHSTAEEYASKHPATFNVVTCLEMLEHVPDPASVVNACAEMLKTNGDVFFSTVNRSLISYIEMILGAEYILKLIPKQTHDYEKFIRPSELAAMAKKSGLKVQHMKGLGYNPLTKRYSLTQSVTVNYFMHCIKN